MYIYNSEVPNIRHCLTTHSPTCQFIRGYTVFGPVVLQSRESVWSIFILLHGIGELACSELMIGDNGSKVLNYLRLANRLVRI